MTSCPRYSGFGRGIGVTVLDPAQGPVAGDDAAEAAWVPTGEVSDLRLVQGVYEFLAEFGVL